jgi:hypothetical protein
MTINQNCLIAACKAISTEARITAVATLIVSAVVAVPAQATPARQFVGTLQWEGVFSEIDVNPMTEGFHLKLKTKGDYDLVVTKIAIGPIDANGRPGSSGWHTHPGSSLVKVTAGVISLYDAQLCTATQLVVGQTFVDEGGGHLHLVRNETANAAEVSVVQIMPRGLPRRIDATQPNNSDRMSINRLDAGSAERTG